MLNGVDPKEERDQVRLSGITSRTRQITFDEALRQSMANKSVEWKNAKHGQYWQNTLATYASPILGLIPMNSITAELVYSVLQPIWIEKIESATRVRQ